MLCSFAQRHPLPAAAPGEQGVRTTFHRAPISNSAPCSSVTNLDHLTISRSVLPQAQLRFSFPSVTVVSNTKSIRTPTKALCELPKIPTHSTISCPAGRATIYRLALSAGDKAFPDLLIERVHFCQRYREGNPVVGAFTDVLTHIGISYEAFFNWLRDIPGKLTQSTRPTMLHVVKRAVIKNKSLQRAMISVLVFFWSTSLRPTTSASLSPSIPGIKAPDLG